MKKCLFIILIAQIILLVVGCEDDIVNNIDNRDPMNYFLPMQVGNTWEFDVDNISSSPPESYQYDTLEVRWEVTEQIDDTTYIIESTSTGTRYNYTWNDEAGEEELTGTEAIDDETSFSFTIQGDEIKCNHTYLGQIFNSAEIPYLAQGTQDTVYYNSGDIREDWVKVVKGIGLVDGYYSDGIGDVFVSQHYKLTGYTVE